MTTWVRGDNDQVLIGAAILTRFTRAVVAAMGAPPEVAIEVAEHLVGANLSGHDSHGVLRLGQYVGQMDEGILRPDASTKIIKDGGSLAILDGNSGFGQWSTRQALDWCIERATDHGLAMAAVRHAMHVGRLGHFAEVATAENLVSIVCAGLAGPGAGLVAPHGGVGRFLSTNPWAIGVPAGGGPPMIMDFATSQMAEGKVRVAWLRQASLPDDVMLDSRGMPTDDPQALYDGGALLGLGGELSGHKGFGLGLAAALLGGLSMIGDPDPTPAGTIMGVPPTKPWLAGVSVIVIDPDWYGGADHYAAAVAEVLSAAGHSMPRWGFDRVMYPGEPEAVCRARRLRHGIPIPLPVRDQLEQLETRFGIALED